MTLQLQTKYFSFVYILAIFAAQIGIKEYLLFNSKMEFKIQLEYLTESMKRLERMMCDLMDTVRTMHVLHMKELRACSRSYELNRESQEDIIDAIAENSDPW